MKETKLISADKKYFVDALEFWLTRRGYTHQQLADRMGVNRNTVTQYANGGRTPPIERLGELAKALEVSVPQFFACKDDDTPDLVLVEKVLARPSAGTGSLETDGEHAGLYSFHKSFIRRKGGTQKTMKIFEVTGDSMEPTLGDGDLIMINTQDTAIRTGHVYLLRIDDELLVKRLETRPGMVVVKSDNPQYRDIEISRSDESVNWEIFGRMVWSCREY